MKNKILLMLLAVTMIAVSCTNEATESVTPDAEINSSKRSMYDIYNEYWDVDSYNDVLVKKYERSHNLDNPSVSVSVKSDAINKFQFFGTSKNLDENGFANLYIPPSSFDEAYAANGIQVGKAKYQFQNITPMEVGEIGKTIASGQVIEWNEPGDGTTAQEDVILVIRADYTLLDREDPILYEPTIIFTEDDGSYVVTDEDLAAFPNKTPLIVTGVRGDYTKVPKSPLLVGTVSIFHTSTIYKL